jgi:tRNA pseudouridine32 synthase/23S rRNA pseudouridine746 synthase
VLIHVDKSLVAVAKPPGETVIPARGFEDDRITWRRLERQMGERLWVVHRLDADTSGVVVLARSAASHRELNEVFERRLVQKHYVALARGTMPSGHGRIDIPLHAARKGKARPALPGETGARDAVTDYHVLHSWRRRSSVVTMLRLRPLTGRHHQIRVHLKATGAPVLFDDVYGSRRHPDPGHDDDEGRLFEAAPCQRLALHASRLVLPPLGQRKDRLVLDAPLPADLTALVEWLSTIFSRP